MFVLLRIIMSFIMFAVFASIVITSFFSAPKYLDIPVSPSLDAAEGELNYNSGSIQLRNSGNFEYILSSEGTTGDISERGDRVSINISGMWKYLSSLRDIRHSYQLSGTGFSISQEGIGEVFIDSVSSPGKVLVLPLSSSVTVSLTNTDGSEVYTDIFLAPHMYLELQPSRASFLKNADAIRVQTVYKLWYLWTDISQIWEHNFLKKYISEEMDFLSVAMAYVQNRDTKNTLKLQEILTQDIGKMPWYETIERYVSIFVNAEKKTIFYKNLVLEGLFDIVQTSYYNEEWVKQVQEDLEALRSIDRDSYNELLELKEVLMSIVNGSTDKDLVGAKIALASLTDWYTDSSGTYFSLYGFALFSSYDMDRQISLLLWRKFLESFQGFVAHQQEKEKQTSLYYQYFSYFLERQLVFLLEEYQWSDTIAAVIDTLGNHIEIFWPSYDENTTSRITWLYVYSEILKKVDMFLRTRYFLIERNANNLLSLHKENTLGAGEVSRLRSQVEMIFKIYDKNDKFLDDTSSRDRSIRKDITFSRERIVEYFAALESYESYTAEYDIWKKNLLSVDIFSQWDDEALSEDKIRSYLEKFEWVLLSSVSIEIVEDYYYKIENAYIGWKSFDFDIYPFASMKLQNIRIDDEESRFVYKLDLIQSDWKEKYATANQQEKSKYNFTRFFYITFFSEDTKVVEEYIIGDTKTNEDKTEIVFKRDRLLWIRWEFSGIKNILLLEYEDIRVERNNLLYDIFIERANMQVVAQDKEGKERNYNWYFDSEYVLSQSDHYFTDIAFSLYDSGAWNRESFIFWNTKVRMGWKVQLQEFSQNMKDMFTHMEVYKWIYDDIVSLYPTQTVQMQYNIYNKKMSFKFDSEGKTYTILVSEGRLEKIYQGTYKILSQSTDSSELKKYIK